MPLPSGPAGTGKKAGPGAMMRAQPRSRNTTPSAMPPTASLPSTESVDTEMLDLRFDVFRNLTYDDLVDGGSAHAFVPDSRSLDGIILRLQRLAEIIEKRGQHCDRGMRLMAQIRAQSHRSRVEDGVVDPPADQDEGHAAAKANKRKRKAGDNPGPGPKGKRERSSSPGSKARQDSRDASASSSLSPMTPNPEPDDKVKTKGDKEGEPSDSDSSDDGRPPPPVRPQANTFGDDPSTFPDPTVYEIREVKPGMSEEELKEIYSVAVHPFSDLADMIAGDPPDKDFSNAKPSNQINFSTFSTYMEPYFRPFTEEDLGFLRERGNRLVPFTILRRGSKHYSEIWAEEDQRMAVDPTPEQLPPNQARGSIESLDDAVAETDRVSVGPLLSRLLQAMRPEHRAPTPDERAPTHGGVNGDGDGDAMNGVASFDFSMDSTVGASSQTNGAANVPPNGTNGHGEPLLPPASCMPESNSEAWKKASHQKLDYQQVEERLKQELRHIGFLPSSLSAGTAGPGGADGGAGHNGGATPQSADAGTAADYDGHFDDEVAARLRLLQERLREQVLINGARKARLTDLVKERMAHQEYQTILEDLDGQVQQAYLKRTRTMGKKPKKSRPGANGAGGVGGTAASAVSGASGAAAGTARPGIGDLTKTLMERRRRWIESIGTVFDDENISRVPRASEPDSSIFKPADMADLLRREKEAWEEEVEEE